MKYSRHMKKLKVTKTSISKNNGFVGYLGTIDDVRCVFKSGIYGKYTYNITTELQLFEFNSLLYNENILRHAIILH